MRVLFLKDAKGIAKKGEIKEVSEGYARNFLFIKNIAVPATDSSVKRAEALRATQNENRKKRLEFLKESAQKFSEEIFEFPRKANGEEIYGSVSAHDIEEMFEKRTGISARVDLPHPLKKIGEHAISLKLENEVPAEIRIRVVAE